MRIINQKNCFLSISLQHHSLVFSNRSHPFIANLSLFLSSQLHDIWCLCSTIKITPSTIDEYRGLCMYALKFTQSIIEDLMCDVYSCSHARSKNKYENLQQNLRDQL